MSPRKTKNRLLGDAVSTPVTEPTRYTELNEDMKVANGQVTINELPSKSRLFKFCEKQIDHWIQSHVVLPDSLDEELPVEFSVSFTEEEETDQVSCLTEIHLGSSVYRGCDLALDTQQAFMHSLKRLQASAQSSH